jgi:hypothetical protein
MTRLHEQQLKDREIAYAARLEATIIRVMEEKQKEFETAPSAPSLPAEKLLAVGTYVQAPFNGKALTGQILAVDPERQNKYKVQFEGGRRYMGTCVISQGDHPGNY